VIYVLSLSANVKSQVLPDENIPNRIIIENDSLSMDIFLDWKLSINSMVYKSPNLGLIQDLIALLHKVFDALKR
jgi:hypothetical protein